MTEEECEQLFQGHEDAQGNVNYEGTHTYSSSSISVPHWPFWNTLAQIM